MTRDYIDITYPLSEKMAIYPGNPLFSMKAHMDMERGDSCNIKQICMGTHTGTHIDAPNHTIADGKVLEQMTLESMNGKAKVLDFTGKKEISVKDLKNIEIDGYKIILFKTDNSINYSGSHVLTEYTTLDYEAAEYLAAKEIQMVGIDYMTIERPRGKRVTGKSIHQIFLSREIYILEGIDLGETKEGDYELCCLPLRLQEADGAPVRAVLFP